MAFSSLPPSYIASPSLSPQHLFMLMDDSQSSSTTSPPPPPTPSTPTPSSPATTPQPRPRQTQRAIAALENELDFLRDECATINVVLTSLRDAYVSAGSPDSQEDDAKKEVRTAYDDLTAKVVQLERKVKLLERELKSTQGEWQGLFGQ
ncbi:hypothetical protein O0I10_012846 [Lichtheimia ornata]|uniref:Uncharacterized protein n=1 Tax=Lichtheimia ornata TaxID=688661 RepID=A0AAD7UR80_9FUNG|nr:uncharacterized protein O0I10_012846 [Lichtheimia ornata]KAJ8651586.1 hypothetical protein O0I10_012846 [Lichtheimia ornata]